MPSLWFTALLSELLLSAYGEFDQLALTIGRVPNDINCLMFLQVNGVTLGACSYHLRTCTGPSGGMFLR